MLATHAIPNPHVKVPQSIPETEAVNHTSPATPEQHLRANASIGSFHHKDPSLREALLHQQHHHRQRLTSDGSGTGTEYGSRSSWFVSRASEMNEFGSRGTFVFDENETTVPNAIWPQVLAAISASLASMVIGVAAAFTSPAITSMNHPNSTLRIELDGEEASWIGSLLPLGSIIGGLAGATAVDKLGRQATILATGFPFFVSWLLIAMANTIWMIYIGRVIAGICIGLIALTLPVYLAETVQPEVRGVLGLLPTTFGNLGVLLSYAAGSYMDWRALGWLGSAVCIPYVILMLITPESPRWYIAKDKEHKAAKSLQWLRGQGSDIKVEFTKMKKSHIISKQNSVKKTSDLFKEPYISLFVKMSILIMIQQFSGINAVIYYANPIFTMSGTSLDTSLCSIILGCVNLGALFVAIALVDRLGRKPLLLISGILMFISLMILGLFFYAHEFHSDFVIGLGWIPVVSLMSFVLAFSIGFGPIPWLIMGEIFPSRIRGPGAAITTTFNYVFTFIVTKAFPPLVAAAGIHTAFFVFAVICALGLVFIVIWIPETRGTSMEDIEMNLPTPVRRFSSLSNFKPFPTTT